jgi:hypothetical protein
MICKEVFCMFVLIIRLMVWWEGSVALFILVSMSVGRKDEQL